VSGIALLAVLGARAAAACEPVPAPVVDRWPLLRDGRDVRGYAPMASVGPVGWPAPWPWRDPATTLVTVPGPARLEATGVDLPEAWLLEGQFELGGEGGELLRVVDADDRWLSVRWDPAAGAVVLEADGERVHQVPAPASPAARVGVGVAEGRPQALVDGALWMPPWADGAPATRGAPGGARIVVGAGSGPVRVRDVVLHGQVLALDDRPWCVPAATQRVPEVEPSLREPKLEFAGYFAGWIGWVPGNDFVARQRLLLEPTVRLSRHTRVTVAVRALDARAVDRTGSTLQPVPPGVSALGEYGVVVEHAYLARWVGEWRLLPFYFVAGRVPLTFGMGLDDRHSLASLAPPPPSTAAVLDAAHPGVGADNGDQFGDPTFPSTFDGPLLVLGSPPQRMRSGRHRTLVGVRGGRHNPWCAGRTSPVCPEVFAPTYEFAGTMLVEQQLVGGPLVGGDGLLGQVDGGARWAPGLRPGGFFRFAMAYTQPRDELLWFAASFEALGDLGLPVPAGAMAVSPRDPTLPAPQFLGDVVGGAGRVDLAVRPLAFAMLTVEGGAAGGLGRDGVPIRGLHPDYNFDLVLFSQVVALATATADPSAVVPTLGGVVNAAFGRVGPTIRIGSRSGIEVPVFLAGATALGPVPGVMDRGWLGLELDTALRLNSGSWRLAADFGWLIAAGAGLDPVALDPAHPTSLELRIGRDL
jgi:hypothetical protein